jgi:hypothetical protein
VIGEDDPLAWFLDRDRQGTADALSSIGQWIALSLFTGDLRWLRTTM